jgi:predicted ATPase
VQGERLHRLSALPSRPASAHLSAAEALGFPAVQLFVECAAESSGEFELSDADVPLVSEICRKGCAAEKAMQKSGAGKIRRRRISLGREDKSQAALSLPHCG